MLYFYLEEGKLAEACIRFTTRDLTVGVFCESFQTLTDFMCLYNYIHVLVTHVKIIRTCTDNFHVRDNHMNVVRSHVLAT